MTKAVVLQEKTTDGTETLLPRTSADLVGYSKANSTATNVQEALDEMNDNFQGDAPGVVARVAALETRQAANEGDIDTLSSGQSATSAEVGALKTGQTETENRLDTLEAAPPAHKASHAAGGSDALTPADIGALPADGKAVNAAQADSAATALKLTTARILDGVDFNGTANVTHYATCSTAAATAEKAVTLAGFVLAVGARVVVRFTVTNTAANPTLNVNATGGRPIRYRNAALTAGYLAANRTYEFVYDGTAYQVVGDINTDANTKYAAGAGLSLTGTTFAVKYGTAAGTAAQGNDARLAGGADWTASKPGIVQRVETLEAKPAPTPNGIGAAPAKHAVNHAAGAADPITPAAIGAANAAHAHAVNELSGVLPIAKGGTGAADAATAKANLGINGMVAGVAVADGYDLVNAGSGNVVATAWWQTDGYISNNVLTLRAKLRQNMTNCNCNRTGKYC